MNSIPETSSTGLSQDRGNLQNAQFSGQARRQTVNVYENLDADLNIKTREGDMKEAVAKAKAQQPLISLFEQLQKNISDINRTDTDEKGIRASGILKTIGEQVDYLINDILKNAFETTLNNFV